MAALFRENGIDYDKVNYFNEPFTDEKLRDLVRKTGLRPHDLFRKAGGITITPDTPDDEVFKAMVDDPNTIQRPIVEVGAKAVVARPIAKALELVGSK
ncbi:MAG: ArsC/Spx/MgsR family protein [Pyrinomonadaceae bacterium]